MPGSQTTPGPTGARNNAPADFAFRQVNNVGTRIDNDFAAQWLAYTLPYRRFADVLADACARIGGDVDCYSFTAVDFHHILLASLPAHSLALRPAHSRGHQFVTRYPKASDISSPPCLLRLLPAGAVAGGACTHWKAPPCHGAHPKETLGSRGRGTAGLRPPLPVRAVDHSTTRIGLKATGRDPL